MGVILIFRPEIVNLVGLLEFGNIEDEINLMDVDVFKISAGGGAFADIRGEDIWQFPIVAIEPGCIIDRESDFCEAGLGEVGDLLVNIGDIEVRAGGGVGIISGSLLILNDIRNSNDDNNDEDNLKNYGDKNDRVEFVDFKGEPVDEVVVH